MNLIVRIPDEMATRLAAEGGDLERRALEAFGLAEYQASRLTHAELGRLLGFETRFELDGFLKAHGVCEECTLADLERDRQDLERAEALVARFRAFRADKELGGLDAVALIREGRR